MQNLLSFRVASEYDSNPAMSIANPTGVWRALVEPGYSLIARLGENDLRAGLGVQFVRSSNKELDPDRDNPAAFFDWLRQSDTGEFGISTRYAEVETRDSGVDATGRGTADSTRISRSASAILNHQLTARSTLSADGIYDKVSFMGGNFVDYSMRSGGLRFGYDISEITTSFCRVSGIEYVPANEGPSRGLADVMLGLNWRTEYTEWTMQGGGAKIGGLKPIPEGSMAMIYRGQRTESSLNAGRTVLPSGLGGFVKAYQARGTWRLELSEYDNTGIDLEGRKNRPVAFVGNSTRSTSANVWVEHDFTPSWSMNIYYRLWINRINGSESATSNIFGLSLSYNTPVINPETQPDHD